MRNPEGYPEGDMRWRERGTNGEGCKGITRFVVLLREIRNQRSGPYPMDFCISGARSTFRTPLISVVGSSHFLKTLGWLVTAEDGRHWN